MANAVALCFRLELGVAAPARGFTHAVSPRRLPLAAANSRPKLMKNEIASVIGHEADWRGGNVADRLSEVYG
jgi:hypothetical protein